MLCAPCCAAEAGGTLIVDPIGERIEGDVGVDVKQYDSKSKAHADGAMDILGRMTPKAAQDHPPSPSALPPKPVKAGDGFEATVTMTKGVHPGIGMDLSEGPYLRVCKVEEVGPVPTYNTQAHEAEHIRVGDFIVEVAGASGDARQLMLALHTDGPVKLSVRRPVYFTVKVDKQGGSLGLDLSYQARSTSAVIKQVFPTGAVAKWNASAAADVQIKPDDFIISVNGTSGTSRQLVQAINESQIVELHMARPAS